MKRTIIFIIAVIACVQVALAVRGVDLSTDVNVFGCMK
jgi:GH25 family lysozyme M1 (1,4-beta-N-acetylmuramidase)